MAPRPPTSKLRIGPVVLSVVVLVVAGALAYAALDGGHGHAAPPAAPATPASSTTPVGGTGAPSTTPTTAPTTGSAPAPTTAPVSSGPLTGKTVVIDPGHNGGNGADPAFINATIWNGRADEPCDTTGTETNGGYTESRFNFAVATLAQADLRAEGATVVLTRTSDTGVGPCVTQRAAIGNEAHADAAVSIHADGGPASGRGVAVLEPMSDGVNDAIVAPSRVLGSDLLGAFTAGTGMPVSTYDGVGGIQPRNDLAGTNLSTVPKVFIECGNMRNATDAALLVDPAWQARAARAITVGITAFLLRPTG